MIIDASVALSWLYERSTEGERVLAQKVLTQLLSEPAVVPALWRWEVANGLLVAERRRLSTIAQAANFLLRLRALPIEIDQGDPGERLEMTLALAREHSLTAYDAAYLELAVRLSAPLATLDRPLGRAAKMLGLSYEG